MRGERVARARLCGLVSLGLMCALPAGAAELPLSEAEFLGEVPVVLSVSRLAQPVQDAPSAVTVIDRETLLASGFREIADVMRLVPGFYVGYASGNDIIVARGMTNAYFGKLQVLVDGRSVYTPAWGQVRWSLLPVSPEEVDRIEVTRGPNAASYGANSFTGIINIITRHPAQDRGTLLGVTSGDPDVRDGYLRHAGRLNEWDVRLSAGHREDSGFAARNDSQHTDYFLLRADRTLDATHSLQVQAGWRGGLVGVGWFGSSVDLPRDRHVASGFLQLRWQRNVSADDELAAQFYYSFDRNREAFVTHVSSPPTVLRLLEDSDRYDLEVQRTHAPTPGLRLVYGGSLRHDRIHAPTYLGTDGTRLTRLQRLFGHAEWQPSPEWTVNAGAMVEHNDLTGTDTAPRLSVTWHFLPAHSVRAGVSQAQRTPTLLEYAADYKVILNGLPPFQWYLSREKLPPERITSREIAYLGRVPGWGLSWDVRFYEERIRDIILAHLQAGGTWTFRSGNWLTRRGMETQLAWRVGNTRLHLAHGFMQTRGMGGPAANAERDLKRADPRHTFGGLLSHRFPYGIEASVGYYHYDDMTPFGNGGDYIRAYSRRDVRIAKRFRVGDAQAEVALVTQNLGDPYHDFFWDATKPTQRNDFTRRTLVMFKAEY